MRWTRRNLFYHTKECRIKDWTLQLSAKLLSQLSSGSPHHTPLVCTIPRCSTGLAFASLRVPAREPVLSGRRALRCAEKRAPQCMALPPGGVARASRRERSCRVSNEKPPCKCGAA
jgi:hypothetical protein